jgi:hypothetical protein
MIEGTCAESVASDVSVCDVETASWRQWPWTFQGAAIMDRNILALLVVAGAALASCSQHNEQHQSSDNDGSPGNGCGVHNLTNSSLLLAPIKSVDCAKLILNGHSVPVIRYDPKGLTPEFFQSFHLPPNAEFIEFALVQHGSNPPTYKFIGTISPGFEFNTDSGNIKLHRNSRPAVKAHAYAVIADADNEDQDSTVYKWNGIQPWLSVGAERIGAPGCPTSDNCIKSQPPNWSADFHSPNPAHYFPSVHHHNWLYFTFPYVGDYNEYKYSLVYFDINGKGHLVDPKIINQP